MITITNTSEYLGAAIEITAETEDKAVAVMQRLVNLCGFDHTVTSDDYDVETA